jgi:hypothetical protein
MNVADAWYIVKGYIGRCRVRKLSNNLDCSVALPAFSRRLSGGASNADRRRYSRGIGYDGALVGECVLGEKKVTYS